MGLDEITPHLNKIATLYLKNNKRKVGWLFIEKENRPSERLHEIIYFISVQKGKKLITELERQDHKALEPFREEIPVDSIERIRSSEVRSNYFFSSVSLDGLPSFASLNSFMPLPNPRASSGMRLPPKKIRITTTRRKISPPPSPPRNPSNTDEIILMLIIWFVEPPQM
jgi:hypothetical protein